MPSESAYTDTVVSILTEHLGPNAVALIAQARRPGEPGGDAVRAAVAEHLHNSAREASSFERTLRERIGRLHDFLARARQDLSLLQTATRWEAVGSSGTITDQAAARFGDALQRLHADAHLYAETSGHLSTPTPGAATRAAR